MKKGQNEIRERKDIAAEIKVMMDGLNLVKWR